MTLIARTKSDQNTATFDPWTVVHLGTGLAAGLMGLPAGATFLGAVLYEAAEGPFEASDFGGKLFNVSKPETRANAVADVVVFMLGFYAGRKWNQTG